MPAIWLAIRSVIYSGSTLFFALNHICSTEIASFRFKIASFLFYIAPFSLYVEWKMRSKSPFVFAFQQTGYLIDKILLLTEFWISCRAILVQNHTCDFKSNWFSNHAHPISYQIALHSVQLPLYLFILSNIRSLRAVVRSTHSDSGVRREVREFFLLTSL